MKGSNIILIGMPSAGKSTVGKHLANKLGLKFIDTDLLILEKEQKPLRDIVNQDGLRKFLSIQEEVITQLKCEGSIIATGGSVVYGKMSMDHLKQMGTIVFLKLDYAAIEERVSEGRRFAKSDGQNLRDLYMERTPLYEKYSHVAVDCNNKHIDEIVSDIMTMLNLDAL